MKKKISYFLSSFKKKCLNDGAACPSCGCSNSKVVERKYFFTALNRCNSCKLLYRSPTTSAEENARYYQQEYKQGFTTDCPPDDLLSKYLENGFSDGEKDYSLYIDVILAAGGKKGDRLFDFGCSWGYGSWQFQNEGFDVESYEISESRALFAKKKLNIKVHSSLSSVQPSFDIFFSSHVLEHVPSVSDTIDFGMSILKPNGLFVAFTPNGSDEFKNFDKTAWDKLWGAVHPNFLDNEYYNEVFSGNRRLLASSPYPIEKIRKWGQCAPKVTELANSLHGSELLVLAKKS